MDRGPSCSLGVPSVGYTPHAFRRGCPVHLPLPSGSRKAAWRSKPYGWGLVENEQMGV